jgi:NitT/TauT family transport system substrate-binding protein
MSEVLTVKKTALGLLAVVAVAGLLARGPVARAEPVRIGVLQFGTVSWGLEVVEQHGLDQAEGCDLEVQPFANNGATAVALQAGAVDVIVNDWIWVARQRAEGQGYSFVPYSTALGALMVPAGSAIAGPADLKGKRLGIAGGPLDKSWLLLRALSRERFGFDLADEVEAVFAAPPLLNEQILAGRLDAVLTYWHYAARLDAAGLGRVMDVAGIGRALGIESGVPLVGYVFDEAWAATRREALLGCFRAIQAANRILAGSDAEWERLRPLMKAGDEATFVALREGFRAGIPRRWGEAERADAARLFAIMAELGGAALVGKELAEGAGRMPEGTFWPLVVY